VISSLLLGTIRVIGNQIKFIIFKFKGVDISCKGRCTSRLNTEMSFAKNTKVILGYHVTTMQNCRILVRHGKLEIGDNTGINSNCVIACHEYVKIGANVGMGPNVCIYDHDHDFRAEGGKKSKKYKTGAVIIEDNVWIGANTVILRGTHIGANSVIAAGSIIRGNVPNNTVVYQKREIKYKEYC